MLEAPFTSVVDVGRQVWWFLPLRLIMTDQYRTIDRIGSVRVPLLILHGARDSLIPVAKRGRSMPPRTSRRTSPFCGGAPTTTCSTTVRGTRSRRYFDTPERVRQPAVARPGSVRAGGLGVVILPKTALPLSGSEPARAEPERKF